MTDPNIPETAPNADRTEYRADAETAFAPGDLVYDRDADPTSEEIGVMVVYDYPGADAAAHEINALGRTVADVNPQYPADDRVVSCVYISDLDHIVGTDRWRAWDMDAFPDALDAHLDEWSLHVRTYDFPESRLGVVVPAGGMAVEALDASTETLQRSAALKYAADRRVEESSAGADAPPADTADAAPDSADPASWRGSDAEPPRGEPAGADPDGTADTAHPDAEPREGRPDE